MRFGWAILSTALAVLWLGMPVHCELELVSASSVFSCATENDCSSPADDRCAEDFCGSFESANYFPQKSFTLQKAPLAPLLFELFPARNLIVLPETRSPSAPDDAVPLLAGSWLFVQRAVAPPRAPDLT